MPTHGKASPASLPDRGDWGEEEGATFDIARAARTRSGPDPGRMQMKNRYSIVWTSQEKCEGSRLGVSREQ